VILLRQMLVDIHL